MPDTVVPDTLTIAGRDFGSRLFLGTGKFPSNAALRDAIVASGTELVTVALRRVDLTTPARSGGSSASGLGSANEQPPPERSGSSAEKTEDPDSDILDAIDADRVLLLTNTSGAVDAEEAVRLARLARSAGLPEWIKLEVTPDPRYLLPDPIETLKGAEVLVREGFTVLPYCSADPVLCKHLEEVGCATVMPLGSWIGSNQGLRTKAALEIIVEQSLVPVVVDAGIGAPSQAAEAMELGADAVLVNTAIGTAGDPAAMAGAFRLAVEAGRAGFRAGLAGVRREAAASSPLTGFLSS
ncbi:MAG TPA: thiazole synthase [Acidimicrobiales bacterium]|nr:thiazole synthase [Acidimicrobiales bacterium]